MGEVCLLPLRRAAILGLVALLAAIASGVAVLLPAILLPLSTTLLLAFARPRLGATLTTLLLLVATCLSLPPRLHHHRVPRSLLDDR
jgi:hypothetical protein